LTIVPTLVPEAVFSVLPSQLREELLDAFGKIVQNYWERRWEPSELNGGKLCEIAYSVINGYADGKYPARASKPNNVVGACRSLETNTSLPRSVQILIPRLIPALYEVRNNRSVGHVGGEVDPNHMDAALVVQMSKWILAELVRLLHEVPVEEAQDVVEALVERETPLIWKVDGKLRILDTKLSMKEKMLILLHSSVGAMNESDVVDFIEYSNASVFRRDVLRPAHRTRLESRRRSGYLPPRELAGTARRSLQSGGSGSAIHLPRPPRYCV
jgi:hypothetical protein